MPNTDQWWSGDTPFPDLEIFVGASEFKDVAGLATIAYPAAGNYSWGLASTQAGNFVADVTAALKRTGVYATPAIQQTQFGTAASQPGPSLVAGTSDPEGIRGFPPFTTANLPTLVGPKSGPISKGIQINSVDSLFAIGAVNATLNQIGLTATNFVNNQNPAVTNLITLGGNGLVLIFAGTAVWRQNVAVGTPGFLIQPDTEVILNQKITAGSGGTANFYGCVLKCSFNLA